MKKIIYVGFLMCSLAHSEAPDLEKAYRQHEMTEAPTDAQFVLIQAPYAAKMTVILDRFTGSCRGVVEDPKRGIFWRVIKRDNREDDKVEDPTRPNYQVFISRLGLKFTTLLNVRTGASWSLIEGTNSDLTWETIPNE